MPKPGRLLCSRRKPRIISPAPTSSTIDSETSATRSALRPRAARAARAAAAALLQHVVQVHARGPQRRDQAEHRLETTEIASANAEHARRRRGCGAAARESRSGTMSAKSRVPPERQHQPETGADQGEHQVLGQELRIRRRRPAPAAARSASSFCRAAPGGQQQVRDVGAGDEQHEADRAEQEAQAAAGAAEVGLVQQDSTLAPALPGFSPRPRARCAADQRGLGLGRLRRDAGLQAADRDHPARLAGSCAGRWRPRRRCRPPRARAGSPCGITPITVRGSPSTWIVVPITSGAAAQAGAARSRS